MLVFSLFIVKLKYMSAYKITTVWNHWNKKFMQQWHTTMTWLSFTLYGIRIPVMFNIHFCIQECKYDQMVWRRRRVGKTTQLISFILILTNVTSNNHTHMVCADVTSTSFADKLCLHISTPAAYMTVALLSWYHLVVFMVTHDVRFQIRHKSAHDYCCFDVPR